MSKSSWTLAALLAITAITATAQTTTGAEWLLRAEGIGPLRIGMRFVEADKAVGHQLKRMPDELRPTAGCDYLPLPGHRGIYLMFTHDKLQRIDLTEPGSGTADGIAIGDPVQTLRTRYPGLASAPEAYNDDELTFTRPLAHGKLAFRFDTLKGKIDRIYAGAPKEVAYVEECL